MADLRRPVFGRFTFRSALIFLACIWLFGGLLPGLLCLARSARYATYDQSMSLLGTFGDSFGSVNSLMASLTFLAAIYSFLNERKRAAEQAVQQEDARRHAENLAMLSSLIHARAAMAEQARQRLDRVRERFDRNAQSSRGPVNLDYELYKHNTINRFTVPYHIQLKELGRLIEHAESQIGWQAVNPSVPEEPTR